MTQEEKEKWLEENAKIAWDFIFERAEDKFREKYTFEDFRDWFCGAFQQRELNTERFRYYYYRACWEYEKLDDYISRAAWDEIPSGIKFTPLPA